MGFGNPQEHIAMAASTGFSLGSDSIGYTVLYHTGCATSYKMLKYL